MSVWRNLTQALHTIGGSGHRQQFGDTFGGTGNSALTHMVRRGLATNNGKRGRGCVWTLTQQGVDVAEGRKVIKMTGRWNRHTRVLSTWLSSLPRDVRITPRPCQCQQTPSL